MKPIHIKRLILGLLITGIMAFVYLVLIQPDGSRGHLINYAILRVIFMGLTGIILLFLAAVLIRFQVNQAWGRGVSEKIDEMLTHSGERLFNLQFGLVITFIFLAEGFLLTWFTLPIPARPVILWMASACIFSWAALRAAYRGIFSKRQSLLRRLRLGWQNWSGTQRKVFIILAVMGLIYFAAFIPANYGGRVHPDEEVIYPDVVNMLIPGATFTETLRDSFIISSWWYGYPYFPMSALTLVIPRIIYGNAFASQIALNLLLMRQFISVLPMAASLILLIYMVNEFKHIWTSIGMFIVLGLIPGVVHYNIRFWHPDSIIVLLVLLTIWLLKRDRLRFGRDFYLAAFTVGLNAVIKVWGLFFFLAIGGYLLAGWFTRKLDFWKMVKAGLFFILVMIGSILITSPSITIPWNLKTYISELKEYYPVMRQGYDEPDPQGVYRLGLQAWMVFFRMHFMQDFFFYFSCFALVAGSLVGTQKTLNRLILAWSSVVGIFLVGWIAVKSFQYLLPLMIPLYGGAFLFPAIAGAERYPMPLQFLANSKVKQILIGIVIVLTAVQFYFNLKLFPDI
jgi:MFS family permease